jgi:hypothetical protein
MREFGNAIGLLALCVLGVGYIWSFILGYRKSIGWLIGLLLFWPLAYPALAAMNWADIKKNFAVVGSGLLLGALSIVILAATNPNAGHG